MSDIAFVAIFTFHRVGNTSFVVRVEFFFRFRNESPHGFGGGMSRGFNQSDTFLICGRTTFLLDFAS